MCNRKIQMNPRKMLTTCSDVRLVQLQPDGVAEVFVVADDFVEVLIKYSQIDGIQHEHRCLEDLVTGAPGIDIRRPEYLLAAKRAVAFEDCSFEFVFAVLPATVRAPEGESLCTVLARSPRQPVRLKVVRQWVPCPWVDVPGGRTCPCTCLLYTSPSPRDGLLSRMPSSA